MLDQRPVYSWFLVRVKTYIGASDGWASDATPTLFPCPTECDVSVCASELFWLWASDARERPVWTRRTRPMPAHFAELPELRMVLRGASDVLPLRFWMFKWPLEINGLYLTEDTWRNLTCLSETIRRWRHVRHPASEHPTPPTGQPQIE